MKVENYLRELSRALSEESAERILDINSAGLVWDKDYTATGDILVASAASTPVALSIGANGTVLTSNGTTASWEAVGAMTETDPVFLASPVGAVTVDRVSHWDSAYGWGNHVGLYDPAGTGVYESTSRVAAHAALQTGVHGLLFSPYITLTVTESISLDQDLTTASGPSFDNLTLTIADGTAPMTITSKTLVANLNADLLDGNEASAFSGSAHNHDSSYISIIAAPADDHFPYQTATGELDDSGYAAADFATAAHVHTGVYEPVIAAGTSAQYWRGDKSWQTLNQAAVAGLTTADGPTFDHIHATNDVGCATLTATGAVKSGADKMYLGTLATSMADDTAISFTPTANARFILCLMGQQATQSGFFACRVAASANFCEIISAGAALEATTGALSGTTGTDTKMTVSTHTDGKVYIENRLGGTRSISYMLIAANAA